jgi:PAS domain S-box-containing protein
MIGRSLDTLIPARFRDAHREFVRGFVHSQDNSRLMARRGGIFGLRQDGAEFPAEASISKFESDGRKMLTVVLRDISERQAAQRAVRDSEERFRDFAEAASDWFWETDETLRFSYFSDRFAEITGIDPNALLGKTRWEFAGADEDDRTWRAHVADLRARRPFRGFRYDHAGPDGRRRHWSISGKPLFDEQGAFRGYRGTGTDITAEIEARSHGEEVRRRFLGAIETSAEAIALFDVDDRLVLCNTRYRETLARLAPGVVQEGVTFEEIVRQGAQVGLYGQTDERLSEFVEKRLADHRALPSVRQHHLGEGRWVQVREHRTTDGGVILFQTDITELRESEERLRQATKLAKLGHWVWDANEDRCIYCSEEHARIHGVGVQEYMERSSKIDGGLSFIHPDDRECYRQALQDLRAGTGFEMEYRVVSPDGDVRFVREIAAPILDETGVVIREHGTIQDITEMKQAEDNLRQAQKMEAVGQLTGGVAHDFNNLLAVISGNTELLADEIGADDQRLQAVLRAATRGAELTQRLLSFSRRQPLRPQPINMNRLISDMSGLLSRTLGAGVQISTPATPGLWQAMADPGQLENALLNLALNARDAMPGGGELRIKAANAVLDDAGAAALGAGPGDYVVLSVGDSGTGISPEVRHRVFEPFFTTKEVGQGSGLGLSMVYGFARQSCGAAAVESEPGVGTIVRLYLPRAVGPAAAPAPSAAEAPRGHGETVLVVEDDPDVRRLAVSLLESLGYGVLHAADETSALKALSETPGIDLLLSDVVLARGSNGPGLAQAAKERRPDLKVLFMSGYPGKALDHYRLDDGARVLRKPFRRSDLAKTVREALDGPGY